MSHADEQRRKAIERKQQRANEARAKTGEPTYCPRCDGLRIQGQRCRSEQCSSSPEKPVQQGREGSGSGPRSSVLVPCVYPTLESKVEGDPESLMADLLAMHEAGDLEPLSVDLPNLDNLTPKVRKVADDIAFLIGLRLALDERRALPYSLGYRTATLGMRREAVRSALKSLERHGVIRKGAPLPPMPGNQYGTATYWPADWPEPEPNEDPDSEVSTPFDGPAPASPGLLLDRAVHKLDAGEDEALTASWLACQLRDNLAPEDEQARIMLALSERCLKVDSRRAGRILESAKRKPTREPWGARRRAKR